MKKVKRVAHAEQFGRSSSGTHLPPQVPAPPQGAERPKEALEFELMRTVPPSSAEEEAAVVVEMTNMGAGLEGDLASLAWQGAHFAATSK